MRTGARPRTHWFDGKARSAADVASGNSSPKHPSLTLYLDSRPTFIIGIFPYNLFNIVKK